MAIVLVVFGALLFTRIMAKSSWDFSLFDTDDYKTETIEIKEGFEQISIQSSVADITFVPAADGKCLVEFYDPSHTRTARPSRIRCSGSKPRIPGNGLNP